MPTNTLRSLAGAMSLAVWAAACTVGPNFVRPAPEIPAHWSARAIETPPPDGAPAPGATGAPTLVTEQSSDLRKWWAGFNDPTLNSLIDRAVRSNLDLRTAMLRVDEARVQRAIAAAGYWPTAAIDASFTRQRLSETTPTGSLFNSIGNILPGGGGISVPNPYNQFQLSAAASWEIDLFGRVRRSVEAADANVQVSVEDRHAVWMSLLADVTQNYLELRGAQTRLRVSQENLATLEQLLDLTRQRRAAGMSTDIDVSNAAAQDYSVRASLPAFELQITQSVNRLSRLIGREPEALRKDLQTPAGEVTVPPEISIGLPADLARRRPDIREAEANLHAATAQIGVAVANLFPRLTLAANGGFQSESAANLLEWASRFGSIGPALDLPIFDRGRWATVHLYDVRAQEAAVAYQRTVLDALHEVENALAAHGTDQQRRTWLEATVRESRDALMLSRQRYEAGVENFIDVLDAERTLQQSELSLADSGTAVSIDLVRLYRALGGGWQSSDAPPQASTAP